MAMDQAMINSVLDGWMDDRATCGLSGLWRGGAQAMHAALIDGADDLALAAALLQEDGDADTLVRLLRGVADRAQLMARTVEIAQRTGVRRFADNAEHSKE